MTPNLSLDRPVTDFITPAEFMLREDLSVDEALAELRSSQPSSQNQSQVMYFYVINDNRELVGILPARQLILSPGGKNLSDIMIRNIITMSPKETLFDALELFAMHRLLAIPVVDDKRQLLGTIEVSLYTEEVFDLAQNRQLNEVFQLIGLHAEQYKQGSWWGGFKLRMPWLLSNITGGLICAGLGTVFQATVEKVVLVALFIPLLLTLAEAISVQTMTLAIEQASMGRKVAGQWLQEFFTASLLGLCSGLIVSAVSMFWPGPRFASVTIGVSVWMTMLLAAMLGRAVPKIIHAIKLNPRVASGPVTLTIVDICTITLYMTAATIMLAR